MSSESVEDRILQLELKVRLKGVSVSSWTFCLFCQSGDSHPPLAHELLERIDQRHASVLKVRDVASDDCKLMLQCRGCDEAVFDRHRQSFFLQANEQRGPHRRCA